ncbi:hypothetical protein SCLCIDRAFT_1217954 [Scleroderma citrinum Foug A]|uniref:Uncharacterized protein n=1 Tax=Scleroderma citrinum Foug A TaxID=1036808 RepID=A0A0C3DTB0_9AGAM|nr:hypothetical protein SCLCIDRAFT_1217954 [Scleroderma citrinum Foug A]
MALAFSSSKPIEGDEHVWWCLRLYRFSAKEYFRDDCNISRRTKRRATCYWLP